MASHYHGQLCVWSYELQTSSPVKSDHDNVNLFLCYKSNISYSCHKGLIPDESDIRIMFSVIFGAFEYVHSEDICEFHITLSTWKQGVGNRINLKTDANWKSNFVPGTDNTLQLSAKISINLT